MVNGDCLRMGEERYLSLGRERRRRSSSEVGSARKYVECKVGDGVLESLSCG